MISNPGPSNFARITVDVQNLEESEFNVDEVLSTKDREKIARYVAQLVATKEDATKNSEKFKPTGVSAHNHPRGGYRCDYCIHYHDEVLSNLI